MGGKTGQIFFNRLKVIIHQVVSRFEYADKGHVPRQWSIVFDQQTHGFLEYRHVMFYRVTKPLPILDELFRVVRFSRKFVLSLTRLVATNLSRNRLMR